MFSIQPNTTGSFSSVLKMSHQIRIALNTLHYKNLYRWIEIQVNLFFEKPDPNARHGWYLTVAGIEWR